MIPICGGFEEFGEALFHKGKPKKGNKCAPWTILKSNVAILIEPLPEAYFVLEGGHLIHIVPRFSNDIYLNGCLAYVWKLWPSCNYDCSNLTKGGEQRQRAAQASAGDFLFDLDPLRQTHKRSSLFNKQRIQIQTELVKSLKLGIKCKQLEADVDLLIVRTAITIITTTNKPVMVLGTDNDPLVMLVAVSTEDLNTGIYMLCQCNPMTI